MLWRGRWALTTRLNLLETKNNSELLPRISRIYTITMKNTACYMQNRINKRERAWTDTIGRRAAVDASIMEDHDADEVDGVVVYIYLGGRVPEHLRQRITHARVDASVKVIPDYAFNDCIYMLEVETHDGINKVKTGAFNRCRSLRGVHLPGVRVIEAYAFGHCYNLTFAEFGDKLERIDSHAFYCCQSLRRIAMPLKYIVFPMVRAYDLFLDAFSNRQLQFEGCNNLETVNLVGSGIHKTIASLYMDRWRDELKEEVNRFNRVLCNTAHSEKTATIHQWIESVLQRIEHYKTQHIMLLKEATTLLELALWKAKLLDKEKSEEDYLKENTKKSKIDHESVRQEPRIISGASIVITNVMPFLKLA